jgi:lambda family phage tail tape measure protein
MANENKDLRFRILASVVGGEAIDRFNGELSNISKSAQSVSSNMSTLTRSAQALAGAWVVREVVSFGKNLINVADEMDELSEKTGVAVEDLAAFKGAAEVEHMSLEDMAGSLRKLSTAIVDTATGSKELKAIFKTLGIEVRDSSGDLKNSGQVLKEISNKFSVMEDGAVKSAIAVKLFGKSGSEIIPFLNKGATELERLKSSIDSDFAARAGAFNDTLSEMSINAKEFASSGLKDLLPTLQEVAEGLYLGSRNSKAMSAGAMVLGETIRITAVLFNSLNVAVQSVADVLGTAFIAAARIVIDVWTGTTTAIVDSTRAAWAAITGDFSGAYKILTDLGEKSKKGFVDHMAEQGIAGEAFTNRFFGRFKDAYDANEKLLKNSALFGNGLKGALEDTEPQINKRSIVADLSDITKARTIERDRVKEFIEQQTLENDQRRQSLGDINLTGIELLKTVEARKLDAEAIRTSKTMTEAQRAELMLATEAIKEQRNEIIELEYQQRRTFQYGAKEYFRTYVQDATDSAKNVKQVFGTAFSSMEDALVSFLKTGKLNFRNFADSVITEILRISVRQAVLAPIIGAISGAFAGAATSTPEVGSGTYSSFQSSGNYNFADGGIMTDKGSLPLHRYSSGGVAKSPQMALFGEASKAEAYVPLPDGRSIPVTMKGGSGDGVNINMTVNVSGQKETSNIESTQQVGKQLGTMIKQSVLSTLIEQQRPGGLLYSR